jgi:hypothetical protein
MTHAPQISAYGEDGAGPQPWPRRGRSGAVVGEHDAPEGTRGSGEPGWAAEGADGERRDSGFWLARRSLRLGLQGALIPAKRLQGPSTTSFLTMS